MQAMSDAEWRAFALSGTRTGKLAVVRRNGQPHVTPIWFLLDGAGPDTDLVFTTWSDSVKAKALHREPRFSLCVDDQEPPYSFVMLRAEARLSEDSDQLRTWAARLGARYMGEDRAEEFAERNSVTGEFLVRGRITKVTALRGIAD